MWKAFLHRPKQRGGMALSNFQYYYWAANIRCLLYWKNFHLDPSSPAWVTMDVCASNPVSLPILLGAPLPLTSDIPQSNPVVKHSLLIWGQFRRSFGLQLFLLKSPIAANHLFAPSMADGAFKIWHRKGLKCFDDLYIDNCFVSFSKLNETFGIANTHFFRFLQIRDFIQCLTIKFPYKPPDNPIDIFLSVNPTSKGIMSNLITLFPNCTVLQWQLYELHGNKT